MDLTFKELSGRRKLFSVLRYIALAALAALVALTIVFKDDAVLMRVFLIASVVFLYVFIKLSSICGKYKREIKRVRAVNGEFTEDKILRQIAIIACDEKYDGERGGIEFCFDVSRKGKISCMGYIYGDYITMDVEFFEGKMLVGVSTYDCGAEDIIDKEVEYSEASPDLTLSGVIHWLRSYYEKYNARSIDGISHRWTEKFLGNIDEKTLKKNKITGRNGSVFNACALLGLKYTFGRDAAASYDRIKDKSGFAFSEGTGGGFADEITETDTSSALIKKGKFLAVDRNYKWSYISDGKTAYFLQR